MITKSSLFDLYCLIEEIIDELNMELLKHLQTFTFDKFSPSSWFIAHVIMAHRMMVFFIQTIVDNQWEDEFSVLYERIKKHVLTTEQMLHDLISSD